MKISVELMKRYSSESQWQLPTAELVQKIGAQLGAVEEVTETGPKYQDIKVVEIVQASTHPNADKLSVYQIFDGASNTQVVSGDTSLQVGHKVAWIAPGQTVPSTYGTSAPVVMEARELRGQLSNGMLASGKELGFNDDHHGVMMLDTDMPAGTLLADAYNLNDTIIDIENKMFTHRPDCFGNLGVAREIAGIQQVPFVSPDWYAPDAELPSGKGLPLTVKNEIPNLVPRYMAVVIDNVKVQPSPIWLQSYLARLGIRPINNVVDSTNYIMVLTGQPLHAFDYDKLAGATIVVRSPKGGETLPMLDGRTIQPFAGAMLICDAAQPIALGGMMGGANSEISQNTTRVVLECATFDMYTIRRASMHHGVFTDAVTRFSKGQPAAQCAPVLAQAVTELVRHTGGRVAGKVIDDYQHPQSLQPVALTTTFINSRLGSSYNAVQIAVLLNNVECIAETHGDEIIVTPPFWRTDITIPEDVVEEVGRLQGYDHLPHELPSRPTSAVTIKRMDALKANIRDLLAAAGANELQTYSFVPAALLQNVGQQSTHAFAIRNALSPELQHYRLSLTPSLLAIVHPNIKAGYPELAIFEQNKIHIKTDADCDGLPREYQTLAFVYASQNDRTGAAYYRAKHYLTYLLDALHVPYNIVPAEHSPQWEIGRQVFAPFEPKRAGYVLVGENNDFCGFVGEYHTAARRNLKLPAYSAGFEIDLSRLLTHRQKSVYRPLLKFPATEQDLCLRTKSEIAYDTLWQTVRQALAADQRLRVTIKPVDIYQHGDNTSHKQTTFRITLQHHDRTLTTAEVNDLLDGIAQAARQVCGAERI